MWIIEDIELEDMASEEKSSTYLNKLHASLLWLREQKNHLQLYINLECCYNDRKM